MPAREGFAPIDFRTRFPALDGVRALAVLMVFARHYGGGSHGGAVLNLINEARQRGWMGVDLFFVLSGFLITGILYDTRTDPHYFQRFFARRALRIFPVFYMVAVVLLALTPVFHYKWKWLQLTFLVYLGNLFANYDFSLYQVVSGTHKAAQATIGHLWSLCVEEQFYLLWPAFIWYVPDRVRLLWTAAAISIVALSLRLAMLAHFSHAVAETWIIRTLPFRMDTLLIGAMLALLLRGPRADRWQRSAKWVLVGAGAGVLGIFSLSPAYDSPWLLSIGLTLTALASAGLIAVTLRPGSAAFQAFYWKPLRTLGKYSYGFYVYHLVFQWGWITFLVFCGERLHSIALAGIVALSCNFIVTFLVAKFSYDLVEVRFLRLKRHFEYDEELASHRHAFTTK